MRRRSKHNGTNNRTLHSANSENISLTGSLLCLPCLGNVFILVTAPLLRLLVSLPNHTQTFVHMHDMLQLTGICMSSFNIENDALTKSQAPMPNSCMTCMNSMWM